MKEPHKPKLNGDWEGPFTAHPTKEGWVIEGKQGLIILDRLTKYEASVLVYSLNKAYPAEEK